MPGLPASQVRQTIDDIMWDSVQQKLTNVGKVLDGKEDKLSVSDSEAGRSAFFSLSGSRTEKNSLGLKKMWISLANR